MDKKIKLLRIVTQAEVVPWHLKNFIERAEKDYDIYITGDDVSRYSEVYPYVTFIDNQIYRKVSIYHDLKALSKLIFTCLKIRPQIMHSIMPKAGLLGSIAGLISFIPIRIHTFTGQVWNTKSGIARMAYKFLDRFVLLCNTACLTDSPSQSNFLAQNGFLAKGKPIAYLGKGSLSGVNLEKFDVSIVKDRNVLRKELGIGENDFVYVYLARKSLIKGIKEMFESFNRLAFLPNTKLLFIGPDESNGYLDVLFQQYSNIKDKIISLGIVKDHEKYLAISDVLCLPSSSEGFGSIVIEASVLGVPAVGFDIVGLQDSIENDFSGILVPYKDVVRFSESMLKLYKDEEKLMKMKVNARDRGLKYFSADAIYSFQNQFYKSLIKEKLNK
jgi:glycosyltransferase involved in cell wall biosynthesis